MQVVHSAQFLPLQDIHAEEVAGQIGIQERGVEAAVHPFQGCIAKKHTTCRDTHCRPMAMSPLTVAKSCRQEIAVQNERHGEEEHQHERRRNGNHTRELFEIGERVRQLEGYHHLADAIGKGQEGNDAEMRREVAATRIQSTAMHYLRGVGQPRPYHKNQQEYHQRQPQIRQNKAVVDESATDEQFLVLSASQRSLLKRRKQFPPCSHLQRGAAIAKRHAIAIEENVANILADGSREMRHIEIARHGKRAVHLHHGEHIGARIHELAECVEVFHIGDGLREEHVEPLAS